MEKPRTVGSKAVFMTNDIRTLWNILPESMIIDKIAKTVEKAIKLKKLNPYSKEND